jgi:hypothetical protein
MPMATTFDYFIAHASADSAAAKKLFDLLGGKPRVFLSSECLVLGDKWDSEILRAQKASLLSVVLISSHTDDAWYEREEVVAAIRMARKEDLAHRVVPVYLHGYQSDEDSPYGLSRVQGLYVEDGEFHEAAARLKATLAVSLQRMAVSPVAPPTPLRPTTAATSRVNIPPRNPHFAGRESQLARIHESLASGNAAALTQAISGLGGIGKTQLATEYAHRHEHEYDLVWWLHAEEAATLTADFAALGATLSPAASKMEAEYPETAAALALQWLGDNDRWLLIYDNAPDLATVQSRLPVRRASSQRSHILVTSRSPAWRMVASLIEVPVLSEQQSAMLLLHLTGRTDSGAAADLANELGNLPLALVQAAAYIETSGCSFAEYLDIFRLKGLAAIERGAAGSDYLSSVASTWQLNFDSVTHGNRAAAQLLRVCAFLDPDGISLQFLRNYAYLLPYPLRRHLGDPLLLSDIVARFRRISLIEREDETVRIHRLVQLVVRSRLSRRESREWARKLIALVLEAFPFDWDDISTWHQSLKTVGHATKLTRLNEVAHCPIQTADLLERIGKLQYRVGCCVDQGEYHKRALGLRRIAFGDHDTRLVPSLIEIARSQKTAGDLQAARSAAEAGLEICERHGIRDFLTAGCHLALGRATRSQGKFEFAFLHVESAIRIFSSLSTIREVRRATSALRERAIIRENQGDVAGARGDLEESIARLLAYTGTHLHPSIAVSQRELSRALRLLGRHDEADVTLAGAISVFEVVLPDVIHPSMGFCLHERAMLHVARGQLASAAIDWEKALRILTVTRGTRAHFLVARTEAAYADTQIRLGRLEEGRSLLASAKSTFQQQLGSDHQWTRESMTRLASMA